MTPVPWLDGDGPEVGATLLGAGTSMQEGLEKLNGVVRKGVWPRPLLASGVAAAAGIVEGTEMGVGYGVVL